MLYYALIFLLVGLVAGALGLFGVAAVAGQISWILFLVGVVILIVHLVTGRDTRVLCGDGQVIRKLGSGGYRLFSRKKNPKTGKRRNLGTFTTRAAARKHERAVQYFKRH